MAIEVENRPDGRGLPATKSLLEAPGADRAFILLGSEAAWDIGKGLKPVALLGIRPVWLLAAAGGPAVNIRQLIDKNTTLHVEAAGPVNAFAVQAVFGDNVRWPAADRQGAPQRLDGLLSGPTEVLAVHPFPRVVDLVEAGRLRVLALTSADGNQTFGAPTFSQIGKPKAMVEGFVGLFAAPKVDDALIKRAGDAVAAALQRADVRQQLALAGLKLPPELAGDGLRRALLNAIEALGPVAKIGNACEVRQQCVQLDYCRPPPCPD